MTISPPKTPLRERLAKLGVFISEGDFITDACGMPGFRIALAFTGLPDIPAAELAALIAKLLNEYVNTPDKSPQEKTRADLMAAWRRWTGTDSSSADAVLFRWLDTLGDHDPALVLDCISQAIQTRGRADTTKGAIAYVAAVWERCRANGVKPGEFQAETTPAETMLDKAKRNMERLAAEERAERMAAARGVK